MALKKNKTIKGFVCEYWRITQLNSNFDRRDAVITLSLYKDKATRDSDQYATQDGFSYDLGVDFSDDIYNEGADTVKNIKLKEAYKIFKAKAVAEAEKIDEKNDALAWFADAEDV